MAAFVGFYIDNRDGTERRLTGENFLVLLRGFSDSIDGRGSAIPADSKHALKTSADALQIDWPLGSARVSAVTSDESNGDPKQAPAMHLAPVKSLEPSDVGPDVTPYRRASAPGIFRTTYDIVSFRIFID